MKIYYDNEIDALYIKLGDDEPDGVIEIDEGINIDLTEDGKIVGIERIDASKKMNINTILSYSLELNKELLSTKIS